MTAETQRLISTWLAEIRFRYAVAALGELYPGSSVRIGAEPWPSFHHVRRGECRVQIGAERVTLKNGDVLMMRSGMDRVVVRGEPIGAAQPLKSLVTGRLGAGRVATFRCGDSGSPASLLGLTACVGDREVPALIALPPFVVLRAGDAPPRLATALESLVDEASEDAAAAAPIVARLAEVVMLMILRTVLSGDYVLPPLAMAARDRRLSPALSAIHSDVAEPWTIEGLARRAGMSRSAFALAFSEALGISPMRYVTAERMRRASQLLREKASVQEAAAAVGYTSTPAFSTAFRRFRGHPPSALYGKANSN